MGGLAVEFVVMLLGVALGVGLGRLTLAGVFLLASGWARGQR